jgi:ligand-binding sensor domain-containing protein
MKYFPAYLSVPSLPNMLKTILLFSLFLICLNTPAQNFSYTHYSIREGLAGSNVYAAIQDKEGFMWFATETGVSRFDGVHFKNFTIEDGLPDNEILGFFNDSKGRLWMMPFRATICYYYNGKLHTQKNDSILRRLQVTGNINAMAEDKEGNLALIESYGIHLIKDKITKRIGINIKEPYFAFAAMATNDSGIIDVFANKGFFAITGETLVSLNKTIGRYSIGQIFMGRSFFVEEKNNNINLTFYESGKSHSFGISPVHLNFSILPEGFFSDNTHDGTFIYNSNDFSFSEHHLPGKTIANVFKDNENNLWFCTQREGVYKLNSPFISNRIFNNNSGKILGVHSLIKHKNRLWVGTEEAGLFTLMPVTNKIKTEPYTASLMGQPRNQTRVLLETKNSHLLIGMQKGIISTSSIKMSLEGSIKDITPAFADYVLVSTSSGVWLVDGTTLNKGAINIWEAIWDERATTAHYSQGTFYIGTLDGLYKLSRQDRKKNFLGDEDPLLKSRIAAIRETQDGTLWIATYDRGIIAYKNKKVIFTISKNDGLSSNICRNLFLYKNDLWVGTDNGLNKIAINGNKYAITKYTVADGLLSNFINAVCVDDSLVYVGTPEGVSYFDDKKISQQAPSLLRLTDIIVSGNPIPHDVLPFTLARRNNNVRFEYAGISYRSGGEIFYRYRLLGLDTGWHITKDNFLNYPTLLPRGYTMELQAVNKFGTKSEIARIPFSIEKFWWETTWVQISGIVLFLSLVGFFMNRRIKQVRLREKEKNLLREQVSSLEQMALRAQMNPHFIFNSLNSIQHYVLDKDIIGANKYIAGFSRLIRLTLDNSSKPEISIEEEIKYLSQYLELEKMRTGNKFNYSINVPENIVHNDHSIPPMILQPFVENSIRHGILYRNDSNGHIKIEAIQHEKGLSFIIEDNGVGRLTAGLFKSKNPIEYQSKGISLTEQRINLMNRNRKEKIEMAMTDVEFEGTVTGTRVIIIYPTTNKKTHD